MRRVPFKGVTFHFPLWQMKWTPLLTRFPRQVCAFDAIECVGRLTKANAARVKIVNWRDKFSERLGGSNSAFEVIFAIIG